MTVPERIKITEGDATTEENRRDREHHIRIPNAKCHQHPKKRFKLSSELFWKDKKGEKRFNQNKA
jgi:hypothetical protein